MTTGRRAPCCWLAAALSLAGDAVAQGRGAVDRMDPYTRGSEAAMQGAGYASFGPFAWTDGHDTRDIEEILGALPLLWVETAHFKIGSSLPACTLADGAQRRAVRAELERLGQRLPRVPPAARTLDPWLRLHLFAMRVEDLYRDLAGRLGAFSDDAPVGPFLGMRQKYTLLLFGTESALARYLRAFAGIEGRFPRRHHFAGSGTLLFATAAELHGGTLHDDTKMHCHVVFNVVSNLLDGYRGYRHELPLWWRNGLAQWYLRRVDPRYNNFPQTAEGQAELRASWRWEPVVRAQVRAGTAPPAAAMLRSQDLAAWSFDDHVLAWSRVDYLMSLGDEGLRGFVDVLKDPFHEGARAPLPAELWERQLAALDEGWQLDPDELDARWRAWVLERYPVR